MKTAASPGDPQQKAPYAILIGMDCITGLQVARLLHQRGVPLIGIASDPRHSCCRTRVYEKILVANTSTPEFIDQLESLGPSLDRKAVLIPCTDMSVLLLSRHRGRLQEWYQMVLPEPETIELLIDKFKFYSFAQKEGFPIPKTVFLHSESDLANIEELRFPCILKPTVKTPEWDKYIKKKVQIVETPEELRKVYKRNSRYTPTMISQEWIQGEDANLFTCNCYFDANSRPLVTFVSRKLRQWPSRAGLGSISDEFRNDQVVDETVRLFKHVNFHGFGYVELKYDHRTGRHYIIEPNVGRPTGRSPMAEGCGVELHYTMYCDALGWPLPENRQQQFTNVKWIYLRRDLQASAYYLWHRKITWREWLKDMRGPKTFAFWSWRDPLPFLEDFRQKFVKVLFRKNSPLPISKKKTTTEKE